MGSTNSLIPVIFLLLLISKSLGYQAQIDQICRETDDFRFCEDIFMDHLFTPNPDIKELTQVALTQTLIYSSDTLRFIDRARDEEKRENIKNLYKICDSGYGLLSSQIQDANFAFARGDYGTVVFLLGKCERFVSDCQFVLGKYLPHLDVRTLQNRVLVKMSLLSAQLIR